MNARRFLLIALVALGFHAGPARADGIRCGTPGILQHLAALKKIPKPVEVHNLAGGKLVRDGFGSHTTRTSTNFTVNTGNNPISDAQAQLVLDAAETSWAVYVDTLGFGPPTGTTGYRLNIYVGWTNDNPSIDYDGGYATIDDQGYPYLVISKNLVTDVTQIQTVISHEFFHDFQMSLDAYQSNSAQWYWEATAEWGAMEVYPALNGPYSFVGAFALTQELPLFFYGDPFAMDPTGQHQYGAGLFPRYVSDRIGDSRLVTDSWSTAGPGDDPIRVLGGLLPAGAIDGGIDTAVDDFSAHNALWDYPQRDLLMPWITSFQTTYPTYHQTVNPLILASGTGGFVDIAPGRHLHELGSHQLVLSAPADKTLIIAIQGQPTGSGGTPATWSATLVRTSPADGIVYVPVPFTGGDGALTVTLPDDENSARLVITVHGNGRDENETFPYLLSIGGDVASPDAGTGGGDDTGTAEPTGCCSTGGGASGSLGLSLLVLVAMRRRR